MDRPLTRASRSDDTQEVQTGSQAPTRPHAGGTGRRFDVAELYRGPLADPEEVAQVASGPTLDEKLRQAYF